VSSRNNHPAVEELRRTALVGLRRPRGACAPSNLSRDYKRGAPHFRISVFLPDQAKTFPDLFHKGGRDRDRAFLGINVISADIRRLRRGISTQQLQIGRQDNQIWRSMGRQYAHRREPDRSTPRRIP
jgi:hypothetical protein